MQKKIFGKLGKLRPVHYWIIFFGIVLYFGAIVGVINYRNNLKTVQSVPALTITSPQEGDTLDTSEVTLQGSSDSEATIFIGENRMEADDSGQFSISVPLTEGVNKITVVAEKNSLKSEKIITVTRVVPPPEPAVEPKLSSPEKEPSVSKQLNNSGPETYWLVEVGSLAAAGAAWQISRNSLRKVRQK